jgi:hypothetical protein
MHIISLMVSTVTVADIDIDIDTDRDIDRDTVGDIDAAKLWLCQWLSIFAFSVLMYCTVLYCIFVFFPFLSLQFQFQFHSLIQTYHVPMFPCSYEFLFSMFGTLLTLTLTLTLPISFLPFFRHLIHKIPTIPTIPTT